MIQVINRAFDILELIARDKTRVFTLTEIADALSLNHATCANIMKTMVLRNYIDQIGHKKGYRLGFMAFQLIENTSYEKELLKVSIPEMERLTKAMNETSLLGILRKNIRVALHQVNGDHDLLVKSKREKDAYLSSSGRLLIALLNDTALNKYIEKYGLPDAKVWSEAATLKGFSKEIERIRSAGYALQEASSHIVGLAVPIFKDKEVVASLSMYLPQSRYNKAAEKKILEQLNRSARTISALLSKNTVL